jgi:hypothetical protein
MTALPHHSGHVALRLTSEPTLLADLLSPLIRLEIASIGAIESASIHESHAGYVMLFHETKTSKQASVEQMNTVLRIAGQRPVESGGLIEPLLRLQTLGIQKASTTALLGAMRVVEKLLLDRYADARKDLAGLERAAIEVASHRARKHWMILTAHIAQRKDGESSHAHELAYPLSHYFAGDEDRVCMRCLLDRPGAKLALEKQDPYTYICAACHEETETEFPVDLQRQMPQWREEDLRDRVIHKALSRPMKLKAVKEVHALLAGLAPEPPVKAGATHKAEPTASTTVDDANGDPEVLQPASQLSIPIDGAAVEEASYITLLFDYRSVRNNW